ncbi:MAG: HD domain-containing protein [bacterium]
MSKVDAQLIGKVRAFVRSECEKPTSKYGIEAYEFHFVPMVAYAKALAREFNADLEIVEVAGWLHDIGSIIYGRLDHHINGARVAREFLGELNYPTERIDKVEECILSHRGSQGIKCSSLEAQIIAEADVMSNFDNVAGIFKASFVFEHLTQGEAKISVREKLERKWSQLNFEKSKDIVRPKYDAAMLLLK